jgi:hypothetical protein
MTMARTDTTKFCLRVRRSRNGLPFSITDKNRSASRTMRHLITRSAAASNENANVDGSWHSKIAGPLLGTQHPEA